MHFYKDIENEFDIEIYYVFDNKYGIAQKNNECIIISDEF